MGGKRDLQDVCSIEYLFPLRVNIKSLPSWGGWGVWGVGPAMPVWLLQARWGSQKRMQIPALGNLELPLHCMQPKWLINPARAREELMLCCSVAKIESRLR